VARYLAPQGVFVGMVPDAERICALLQNTGEYNGPHCSLSMLRAEDVAALHPRQRERRDASSSSGRAEHAEQMPERQHGTTTTPSAGTPAPTGLCYRFSMDETIRCFEYTLHMDDLVRICDRHGLSLLESTDAAHFARLHMADPPNRCILRRMGLLRHSLSLNEWETVRMYRVFAFVKRHNDA
jgi:hypothetical protein